MQQRSCELASSRQAYLTGVLDWRTFASTLLHALQFLNEVGQGWICDIDQQRADRSTLVVVDRLQGMLKALEQAGTNNTGARSPGCWIVALQACSKFVWIDRSMHRSDSMYYITTAGTRSA